MTPPLSPTPADPFALGHAEEGEPLDGEWWSNATPQRGRGDAARAESDAFRRDEPAPAARIFDFHLPSETSQAVHALHAHAEFLLDEMEMAGADQDALAQPSAPRPGDAPGLAPIGEELPASPSAQADGPADPSPGAYVRRRDIHSQVLPETELPTIHNRPAPRMSPPAARSQWEEGEWAEVEWEEFDLSAAPNRPAPQPILPVYEPVLSAKPINARPESGFSSLSRPGAGEQVQPISVTSDQAIALRTEIDLLMEEVNLLQQARREITGHALSLLEEAQRIVRTQPERLGRAEYNLRQVRGILERAYESRRRSVRNMVQIFLYLALVLGLCVAGIISLVRYPVMVDGYLQAVVENPLLRAHSLHLLWTVLAGATGGVIGAIFGVVSQQRTGVDFDRQYVVRYLVQPLMGGLLGLLTYFIVLSFFNNLAIDLTSQPQMRWIPVGIATVAGLWQQVVYSLLYRLFSLLSFRSRRR